MRLLALLAALSLSLSGCALAPEGSEAGFWFRIGYDANRSFAYQWGNLPRDPNWHCPGKGGPDKPAGVPTWMSCEEGK